MKKKTTKSTSDKKPRIIHTFNVKALLQVIKHLMTSEEARNIKQTYNSMTFFNFLKSQRPLPLDTFKVVLNQPLYRVTPHNPTSITGNLAFGGRYNIGGSQLHKMFKIKPFAALYLSTDLQCAIDEYRQGTSLAPKDVKYAMTPSKELHLWDIEKVVNGLGFPNLHTLLNQGPVFNSWGYCKVPMQSQILSFWLKSIGRDGIMFPSTQGQGSHNIALFIDDNNHSSSLFSQIKRII